MIGELKSLVATQCVKSSPSNCLFHTSGKTPFFICQSLTRAAYYINKQQNICSHRMTELSIILQKQTLSQYSFVCCLLALLLTLLCVLYNHFCPHFPPDVKRVQVVSSSKAKACLVVQPSGAEYILEVGSLILASVLSG